MSPSQDRGRASRVAEEVAIPRDGAGKDETIIQEDDILRK
jgi:hypothetical protein